MNAKLQKALKRAIKKQITDKKQQIIQENLEKAEFEKSVYVAQKPLDGEVNLPEYVQVKKSRYQNPEKFQLNFEMTKENISNINSTRSGFIAESMGEIIRGGFYGQEDCGADKFGEALVNKIASAAIGINGETERELVDEKEKETKKK